MSAAGIAPRAAALRALGATLRRKCPLDLALEESLAAQPLADRDAGFARAIANETLRRFGQLDDLVRRFVPRAPPPHRAGPTLEILLAGACELLFLDVAPHAAVDGANRLAAADPKAVHFKPLINAALRRIAREGSTIAKSQDAVRLNTPDWLWIRWRECYGESTARMIASIHAQTPPLDLNVRESDVTKFFPSLLAGENGRQALEKASRTLLPGGIVRLQHAGRVEALPGYTEGMFWVQDFAASLPVRLLGDVAGRRVIDLCAAPGGKTAQLAAAGAEVTAVERDAERLHRLASNLERLELRARLVQTDARDFQPERPADRVLLDAPCSATGTIRRHPELPWIKSAGDIAACADSAGELLDAAAEMVAPGGMLVFAVCSLEPEEGPEQVAHFLGSHGEFRRLPIAPEELFGLDMCLSSDGDLRSLPCHLAEKGGMDGFYGVRLARS
ncbi:MAG: RsmB/NOP family class I SAM-dependent RNA methyltransferase [Rhizomicrobium sp.]